VLDNYLLLINMIFLMKMTNLPMLNYISTILNHPLLNLHGLMILNDLKVFFLRLLIVHFSYIKSTKLISHFYLLFL